MELSKVYDELYGMIEDLRKQIGSGGGGGGIEINPAGAATDDLEKIKKGSSIYGLNYNKNANRPQINGNLLTGNKNCKQLNIAEEMTEAAYAALASKNENEIYFLSENAPIFTETDTVAASEITWSAGEDPDTYIATLSYSVEDPDTTGVTGVTCDSELITIGDPTYELGAVSVPMICEDPTAITGDLVFTFTLTQPVGSTRIVKDGITYGNSNVYSGEEKVVGDYYGDVLYAKTYTGITLPASTTTPATFPLGITGLSKIVKYEGVATDGTNTISLPMPSVLATSVVDIYISNGTCYIDAGSDRHTYTGDVTVYYTKTN